MPIPPLTEDRRKEMVKHLHKVLENHRTAVRNIRRDIKEAIEHLEKEKKISEDERKRAMDELDKITHSETKKIERSLRRQGEGDHGDQSSGERQRLSLSSCKLLIVNGLDVCEHGPATAEAACQSEPGCEPHFFLSVRVDFYFDIGFVFPYT